MCLETLSHLRERGIFTVLDQRDPGKPEEMLVQQEREKWPGWEVITGQIPEEYYLRCAAEWQQASLLVAHSDWTKRAMVEQGADAEKIIVVPLVYESTTVAQPRSQSSRPLTVLWVGTVSLRKGIQYLLGAARALEHRNVRFVIAGDIEISDKAVTSAPKNVSFIGRVVRDQIENVYRAADVFALPTISDGFALTQVEAMAHGLPVIATERCGQVVTDGIDGFITPIGDAEALASAIQTLDEDRSRLAEMSACAIAKSRQFSLQTYAERINAAVLSRRSSHSHSP
jgi:glycosyltransferase involved in cell wall biosynthesis